jgi:ATP-dependent Zn protease
MLDRDATVAIHEAGHAVISRVLQLPSGRATIDGKPGAYLTDDGGLASLLTALAGSAAEVELLGLASVGGVTGDRPKILRLLDTLHIDCDSAWLVTRQLVRANEAAIRSVADALLQHGTLAGPQIDALMRGEGG